MKTEDCRPTQIPPKPRENAIIESGKMPGKAVVEAKTFTAFVTSEKAEITYSRGAYFMRFFIIPFMAEKIEIKEIMPIQLMPAFLTESVKL
jgi:hypothetical protein